VVEENASSNEESLKMIADSLKESYLKGLELITAFAFSEEEGLSKFQADGSNMNLVIGSILSHTKFMFEYVSEMLGMPPKEVYQGYAYHFYANILPDVESMFSSPEAILDLDHEHIEDIIDNYFRVINGDEEIEDE